MPLNLKQMRDWANEAQEDMNRPIGEVSKNGSYRKFMANSLPIVFTLLDYVDRLKGQVNAIPNPCYSKEEIERIIKMVKTDAAALGEYKYAQGYEQATKDVLAKFQ